MNGIVSLLGIQAWKPVLTALLLPPVPLLLAILIGVWFMRRQRRGAIWLVVVSVIALWLIACSGFARGLESLLLGASPPLRAERVAQLRAQVASSPGETPVAARCSLACSLASARGLSRPRSRSSAEPS